ncbi:hypothetical protein CHUUTOTORO_01180 [Serratia phage vB_SmaM-ChuuTotoro]|nr:hypothetical protein CHUUTOTORO_01180 [Serratia phage vB_SmaM-ChuuTotoro]
MKVDKRFYSHYWKDKKFMVIRGRIRRAAYFAKMGEEIGEPVKEIVKRLKSSQHWFHIEHSDLGSSRETYNVTDLTNGFKFTIFSSELEYKDSDYYGATHPQVYEVSDSILWTTDGERLALLMASAYAMAKQRRDIDEADKAARRMALENGRSDTMRLYNREDK